MSETKVAIVVRVSSKKQETDRQVHELKEVAARNQWTVTHVIEETMSGASKERPALDQVLDLAAAGEIQKVLAHEVSRIARRNSVSHRFLDTLSDLGVSLYWHAQKIETLLPDGRRNPAAGIMFSLLAEMARAERETMIERVNSGLAEARRKGVRLGRSPGAEDPEVTLARHSDVVTLLQRGFSIRNTAARTKKAAGTVQKVKRLLSDCQN